WRQANRYHVPRLAFINKMDRVGANFNRVLQELRDSLGANAASVLLPWGSGDQSLGQLYVVDGGAYEVGKTDNVAFVSIPDELRKSVESARADLIARIADIDDEVASFYLSNQNVPSATLKAAIRRATIANRFVPVIAGSAYQHIGVQLLLDAIVDYLPSPIDTQSITAHIDGAVCSIGIGYSNSSAALVLKVAGGERGRRACFLRHDPCVLSKGAPVVSARTGRQPGAGRLIGSCAAGGERRRELAAGRSAGVV